MSETFTIVRVDSPPFRYDRRRLPPLSGCEIRDTETRDGSPVMVIVEPMARRSIYQHIGWASRVDRRQHERAGLLIGEIVVRPDAASDSLQPGDYTILVNFALAAEESTASEISVEMNFSSWTRILQQAERLIEMVGDPALRIVGWYHTHPNELQIFFSEADRRVQRQLFSKPWQVGLVFNPHHMTWGAFLGSECRPCSGWIVDCAREATGEPAMMSAPTGRPPPMPRRSSH